MVGECLADDDLATLLSGEGDAAWRDRVERHIDACGSCRSLLADLAGLEDSRVAAADGAVEQRPLSAGDRVDHFEIVGNLGRGAMGEVYEARDTKLDRRVALKVVQPGLLGSAEAIARFGREAKATARFNHPNIVTIHAVGEHLGQPYVALELLEGETLQQRVERGALPQGEAIATARSIAEALAEAHRHGVLHRDLKPGNVHVDRGGRVRVLDFGLAKLLDEPVKTSATDSNTDDVDAFETRATAVTGTPAYMAPEQWRGEPTDAATDVWALGLILHQMLTGRHPYAGLDARGLAAEVSSDRPVPRLRSTEVPSWLIGLAEACVAKRPAERPSTAAVIERLGAGEAVRPTRARMVLGVAVLLALGGLGVWSLGTGHEDQEPAASAASGHVEAATAEREPPAESDDPAPAAPIAEPSPTPPSTDEPPPPVEASEPDPKPRTKPARRRRTGNKQELFGTRE